MFLIFMVFNAHYAASSCTIKFISHTHTFVTFVRRFKRHISSIPQLAKQSIGSHHVFHSYQHSMCKTSTYLLIASFCTKSATTAAKYMWECKFLSEFCWALYQMWSSLWYSLYLLLWISQLFSVFKPAKNKKTKPGIFPRKTGICLPVMLQTLLSLLLINYTLPGNQIGDLL